MTEERHKWLQFAAFKAKQNEDNDLELMLPKGTLLCNQVPVRTIKNYLQHVEAKYFQVLQRNKKLTAKIIVAFITDDACTENIVQSNLVYALKNQSMQRMWQGAGMTRQDVKNVLQRFHKVVMQALKDKAIDLQFMDLAKFKSSLKNLAETYHDVELYLSIFCSDEERFNQFAWWYMANVFSKGVESLNFRSTCHKFLNPVPDKIALDIARTLFSYWQYLILPYYENFDAQEQINVDCPTRKGFDAISYYLNGGEKTNVGYLSLEIVKFIFHEILELNVGQKFVYDHLSCISDLMLDIEYVGTQNLRGSYVENPTVIITANQGSKSMSNGSYEIGFFNRETEAFIENFLRKASDKKIRDLDPEVVLAKNLKFFDRHEFDGWDIYFAQKICQKKMNISSTISRLTAMGYKFCYHSKPNSVEIAQAALVMSQIFSSQGCSISLLQRTAKELGFGWCGLGDDIPQELQDKIIQSASADELFYYITRQGLTNQLVTVLAGKDVLISSLCTGKDLHEKLLKIKNRYPQTWKDACENKLASDKN